MVSDFVWPSSAKEVCDKATCVVDGQKGVFDVCCYGHYENDQMLDFDAGDVSSFVGPTNGQTMADTDPTSLEYAMPLHPSAFVIHHGVKAYN